MPLKNSRHLPPPLSGFESVHRYWSAEHDAVMAKIKPGEYYVTRTGEILTTVLGSCVAACIRDPDRGVGGMNHFMLPLKSGQSQLLDDALRYGNYAMEHLINDIIKYGGRKPNLEIKVFGGANIGGIGQDVGLNNARFVCRYLAAEGYTVAKKDLGGSQARKIIYFPASGRLLMKKLDAGSEITSGDKGLLDSMAKRPVRGEVELFV